MAPGTQCTCTGCPIHGWRWDTTTASSWAGTLLPVCYYSGYVRYVPAARTAKQLRDDRAREFGQRSPPLDPLDIGEVNPINAGMMWKRLRAATGTARGR